MCLIYCILITCIPAYFRRRKKSKPSILVVIHHDDGHTEEETVELSQELEDDVVEQDLLSVADDQQFMDELEDEAGEGSVINENMSLYCKKVQRKQKPWEDLRFEALKRTFQFAGQALPSCVMCWCQEEVSFRCKDCSFEAMFCKECLLKVHTRVNLYHNVEVLKVSMFYIIIRQLCIGSPNPLQHPCNLHLLH